MAEERDDGSDGSDGSDGVVAASDDRPLSIEMGHEELRIRHRYTTLSIVNDFVIGLWFLVGSIMFLSPAWTERGTWCFIAGSFQLLLRPTIRLGHSISLRRVPESRWEL